jgi:uncharacterized protein involved in cysteine biosynthesis
MGMKALIIITLILNIVMVGIIASYCFWFAPAWVQILSWCVLGLNCFWMYLEIKSAPQYENTNEH